MILFLKCISFKPVKQSKIPNVKVITETFLH